MQLSVFYHAILSFCILVCFNAENTKAYYSEKAEAFIIELNNASQTINEMHQQYASMQNKGNTEVQALHAKALQLRHSLDTACSEGTHVDASISQATGPRRGRSYM